MIPDPNCRLSTRLRKPELRLGLGAGLLAGGTGSSPAASFDFLSGETLDSRVTFTRASPATRVNSAGVLELVGNDVARFDYDPVTLAARGLLIEEGRTNLLLNSLLNGTSLSTQTVAVTAQTYTLSFYGTGSVTLSGAYSGSLNGTGGYPGRVTLTFTPAVGTLTLNVAGSIKYAQLEAGAFATSFIPTAGASATRGTDIALVASIGGWFNPVEGSAFAEADVMGESASNNTIFSFDDGTTGNRLSLFRLPVDTIYTVVAAAAAVQVNGTTLNSNMLGVPFRVAFAYKVNDFSTVLDGGETAVDTTGSLPLVTQLRLGNLVTILNGHFRKFRFYNRRLPDAKLQEMTA